MGLTLAGATALAGGVSALSNVIGGWLGHNDVRSTNDTNLKIARESFDNNVKMWQLENEYNTPENQMARYKEAGLNPNLMFGSVSPGNASNAPQLASPRMDSSAGVIQAAATNVGNTLMQTAMQRAQIDNMQADSELKRSQANTESHRPGLIDAETGLMRQRTQTEIAQSLSARVHANVDKALQSIYIAEEYQKLNNLTAQEKDLYAGIAYKNVQKTLAEEHVTMQQFTRALEAEKFSLEKEIRREEIRLRKGELKMRSAEYGLKYDQNEIARYNALTQRQALVQDMQKFIYDYKLRSNKLQFDKYDRNRSYNLEKASNRVRLFNPSSWFGDFVK